jgi:RHS repeat-associated protein
MKHLLYLIVLFPIALIGQTQTENYVKTTTYKGPGATLPVTQVTYFDGLGRPVQQIANAQSSTGKDIVTPMTYDAFGRMPKEYLPYANTAPSLNYNPNAGTEQASFYNTPVYENTLNPYNEKAFEPSPLNRVVEQAAPGADWAINKPEKHTIRLDYQTNVAGEVKCFKTTATWDVTKALYDIVITQTTTYDPNQLSKTITKDENWVSISGLGNTTEEFKDKKGQVILKRTYSKGGRYPVAHDTYYVYDSYGNLTFVLPPLAEGSISPTVLDKLCYQYKYDYRNRLVEKKLPGKQWEYIVYDQLDRPVATGPALFPFTRFSKRNHGWLVTKYDAFNRPVLTAWLEATTAISSTQRKTIQDIQNNATVTSETKIATATDTRIRDIPFRYTNLTWPTADYHVLTVNYYDDYNFPDAPVVIPSTIEGQTVYYNNTLKPIGLPTGSLVRILFNSGLLPPYRENEMNYILYDDKSRPIRTYASRNMASTFYTQVDTKYDFIGKTLYTITKHKFNMANNSEITIKDSFTYSPQDRLLLHKQQINALPEQLIASNTYDELGQLTSKKVGGTNVTGTVGLQKADYAYNIRGWLKNINDVSNLNQGTDPVDLFSFRLSYNNAATGTPLYNGNISETYWKTNTDNVLRKYNYSYDALNRLTNATYGKSIPTPDNYNESLSYDKNGNILNLFRTGASDTATANPIDDLVYTYSDNKLMKVLDKTKNPEGFNETKDIDSNGITDNLEDYTYDLNGNMISDTNKGITSIVYNHLNLPTAIIFANSDKIEYFYNALGQKIQKIVVKVGTGTTITTSETTNYLSGFQYKGSVLQFFPQAEGYVNNTVVNGVNVYSYVFNYTDHLGNVRLSYSDANNDGTITNTEIIEENSYYPFGLKQKGYNNTVTSTNPGQKLKYNGKELQDELGLNLYDYGARNYDAAIGRWMNIDPLTERHSEISPFVYCANNPIKFIDPDGRDWVEASNGNITWRKDVNSKNQSETLKDGEIYRGKSYERIKDWDGVTDSNGNTINNIVLEEYGKNKKMTYSELESSNVSIEGSMREDNSKLGDVEVKIYLTFGNGKTRFMSESYTAVAGGFGNGAPENGDYTITNYQDRSPTGWYSKGMNNNNIGFSFNLNPSFSTGRTDLRIHPDGNNEGTLGCIGMSGNTTQLTTFRDNLRMVQKYQTTIPGSIDIIGNPNNNGRSGAKIPNVNE